MESATIKDRKSVLQLEAELTNSYLQNRTIKSELRKLRHRNEDVQKQLEDRNDILARCRASIIEMAQKQTIRNIEILKEIGYLPPSNGGQENESMEVDIPRQKLMVENGAKHDGMNLTPTIELSNSSDDVSAMKHEPVNKSARHNDSEQEINSSFAELFEASEHEGSHPKLSLSKVDDEKRKSGDNDKNDSKCKSLIISSHCKDESVIFTINILDKISRVFNLSPRRKILKDVGFEALQDVLRHHQLSEHNENSMKDDTAASHSTKGIVSIKKSSSNNHSKSRIPKKVSNNNSSSNPTFGTLNIISLFKSPIPQSKDANIAPAMVIKKHNTSVNKSGKANHVEAPTRRQPRRLAAPTDLTEPLLNKKMRRLN